VDPCDVQHVYRVDHIFYIVMLYDLRPFLAGWWQALLAVRGFWGDYMEPYIIECESGGKRMGGTAVAQVANQGDIDPIDWHGLTYCVEVKQSLEGCWPAPSPR